MGFGKIASSGKKGVERASLQLKEFRKNPEWIKKQAEAARKALTITMNDPAHLAEHVAKRSIPQINKINASVELRKKAAEAREQRYLIDDDLRKRRSDIGLEMRLSWISWGRDVI